MPLITGLTAAFLGLLLIILFARVATYRVKSEILLGTGGDETLERRIRAQGNFIEYTPFAIILIMFNEFAQMPFNWLIAIALFLVIGRCAHAFSISHYEQKSGKIRFRVLGMICTITSMFLSIGGIFYVWLVSMGMF